MVKYAATALVAMVVLGGCNSSSQPPANSANGSTPASGATAPLPAGNILTGTISLREPMAINEGARIEVKLVDVAMPDYVLAEHSETVSGQPPYAFTMAFDPSKIDRTRTYVVNVLMFDGDRRFVPALQSPVLTGGAGNTAEVVLNSEATPGEKLNEEFTSLKSRIGGMRRIQDSFLNDDLSVAWDGFVEAGGKVRFMRVNSEKGDGDTAVRSNVEYAFLDEQPMVVSRRAGNGFTRVGWDTKGNLVLNRAAGGGTVSEEEARSFHADALKALAMAQPKAARK